MKKQYKDIIIGIAVVGIVVGIGVYVLEATLEQQNQVENVCNEYNGTVTSGQHYHCGLENGTEWHIISVNDSYIMAEPNDIETCHSNGWLGCDNHFFTVLGIVMFIAIILIVSIYGPRGVNNR